MRAAGLAVKGKAFTEHDSDFDLETQSVANALDMRNEASSFQKADFQHGRLMFN